ncbi:MAG: hypothetical protein AB8H03_18075 [Saprospiraceae bacterium]
MYKTILIAIIILFISVNLKSQDNLQIFNAIYRNDLELVKKRIDKGIDIKLKSEDENLDLIMYSVFWHKNEIFKFLNDSIEFSEDIPKYKNSEIFRIAILGGNISLIEEMLMMPKGEFFYKDLKEDVIFFIRNYNVGKSFINNDSEHLKIIPSNADTILLSILAQASVIDFNSLDNKNRNILFSLSEYSQVLDFLINANVDLNIIDIYGKTNLDYKIGDLLSLDTFTMNNEEFFFFFLREKFIVIE